MRESKLFCWQYDLTVTAFTYPRLGGPDGYPVQPGLGGAGAHGAITSGSSTTVTAVAGTPFDPVKVGDIIVFQKLEQVLTRKITAKASGASLTVDAAVDLSGGFAGWYFYPFLDGNGATNGWHAAHRYQSMSVLVDITAFNGTGGVDVVVEGRTGGLAELPYTLVASQNFATFPVSKVIDVPDVDVTAIRVGLKAGATAAGTDNITVSLVGTVY